VAVSRFASAEVECSREAPNGFFTTGEKPPVCWRETRKAATAALDKSHDPEQVSVDRSTKTTLILTTAWIKIKSYSNE